MVLVSHIGKLIPNSYIINIIYIGYKGNMIKYNKLWKPSRNRAQTKLVANSSFEPLSMPETQGKGISEPSGGMMEVSDTDFLAKRIEEGNDPNEALRLLEIVKKRRSKQ